MVATEVGQEFWVIANRRVLGLLELLADNPSRAVEYLQPPARGVSRPSRMPRRPTPGNGGRGARGHQQLDAAAELLGALQDRARGIDSPWERAIRARCGGLIRSAQGDHDGALAAFDEALEEHEQLNLPFDGDARCSRSAPYNDDSGEGVRRGCRSRPRWLSSRSSALPSGRRRRAPS